MALLVGVALVLAACGDDSSGSTTTASGGGDGGGSDDGSSAEVPDGSPAASMADDGSDESLDALADDCEAGELAACDTLYEEPPEFSAHEGCGITCGGRYDPSEEPPEFSAHEGCGITCGGRYDPSEEDIGDPQGQLAVRRSGGSECEAPFADAG